MNHLDPQRVVLIVEMETTSGGTMKRFSLAYVAIFLFAVFHQSHAQIYDLTITVDNAYAFGFGSQTEIAPGDLQPPVINVTAGQIFGTGGPETYLGVDSGNHDYVYIAAWADNATANGVLASFTIAGVPQFSTGVWEVFATGDISSSVASALTLQSVNAQIALAHTVSGGPGGSFGWVNTFGSPNATFGKLIADPGGALYVEAANLNGFESGFTDQFDPSADWLWYDNLATSNPFDYNPAGDAGWLIFRAVIPIICGDSVVEEGEVCDTANLDGQTCESQGFDSGTLSCFGCDFDFSACVGGCGNAVIDPGEVCDGDNLNGETCQSHGFGAGSLICNSTCDGFITSQCSDCGNAVIDPGEVCDGGNLNGETCQSQGFGSSGTLGCGLDCTGFDASGCFTCGNNVIEGPEVCDGFSLNGLTCSNFEFGSGVLGCSPSCSGYDTSDCSVSLVDLPMLGEWGAIVLVAGLLFLGVWYIRMRI